MKETRRLKLLLVSGVLVLASLACVISGGREGRQTTSEVIDRGSIQQAQVTLKMGAGQLSVDSGTDKLMEGEFTYQNPAEPPLIDYAAASSRKTGELVVEQGEVARFNLGDDYYLAWDLLFTEAIPLDFSIVLGAGEGNLDLREIDLRSLKVEVGAGESQIWLGGDLEEDVPVTIRGGVGELTVRFPAGTPVSAKVAGGIGEIKVSGLSREGSAYVSPEYGSGPALLLDIEGGVGEVRLEVLE